MNANVFNKCTCNDKYNILNTNICIMLKYKVSSFLKMDNMPTMDVRKGPFTNDVIVLRGDGGLQIMTADDGGGGGGKFGPR